MPSINVYEADYYVIAIRTIAGSYKIFQILLGKDGSIYVTVPYFQGSGGQMGVARLTSDMAYPTSLTVGDHFVVSTHNVKYSHHPSGSAQFSLTGKVKSSCRKSAIPLSAANGHLFTLMVQGLSHFESKTEKDRGKKKRGFVEFGLDCEITQSVKFLGYLYSATELAKLGEHKLNTPWTVCVTPDGRRLLGIPLATSYSFKGERRFLMLAAEKIPQITTSQPVFISLMGGFDVKEVALDHSKDTSFLLFIYPAEVELSLLENIDIA